MQIKIINSSNFISDYIFLALLLNDEQVIADKIRHIGKGRGILGLARKPEIAKRSRKIF